MTSTSTYVVFTGVLVENLTITNVWDRKNMVLEDGENGGKTF